MKIKKDWRGIVAVSAAYIVLCLFVGAVMAWADQWVVTVFCGVMGGCAALKTWIERKHWVE